MAAGAYRDVDPIRGRGLTVAYRQPKGEHHVRIYLRRSEGSAAIIGLLSTSSGPPLLAMGGAERESYSPERLSRPSSPS